jgi:hypothetical protein
MLILTATNVTDPNTKRGQRKDGTADYDVWVGINQVCIWRGSINGHVRDAGAEALLRLIADKMEARETMKQAMPVMTRFLRDSSLADDITELDVKAVLTDVRRNFNKFEKNLNKIRKVKK